ncbi:calcium-binding protein [Microvirga sesbaniae]|uniref:calcium-binding protein n=1 Tax=Microvirga sesbaniae TaxID=681392 RepID=UPI0021C7E378|nr:calcium-binding protein [Microvirga sp. HBU67692]
MAVHDETSNTFTLQPGELNFALKPEDGDALVIGNDENNQITGNGGSNFLDGGAGVDTLRGAQGDDFYVVDTQGDTVAEGGGAGSGHDTVAAAVSWTLGANFEELILVNAASAIQGQGNGLDNALYGNDNDNVLIGLEGDDTLDGGAGADTLRGGLGDDIYHLAGGDDVIEGEDAANGGGDDTIISESSIDLDDYPDIENLILEDAADIDGFGNALDNVIQGNDGSNILDGRDGDDSLSGGLDDDHLIGGDGNDILDGGDGDDRLEGGAGDDTYFVDGSELIIEGDDEGNDTVIVTVTMDYTIVGTQIENIVLMAGGSATGNDLDNDLVGGDLDDALSGGTGDDTLEGGLGDDVLTGGEGDDTYYVDSNLDIVVEQVDEGRDKIVSSIGFDLRVKGANVEDLQLAGSASVSGIGSSVANMLGGNDGSNSLSGLDGNDTLSGGLGNDTMDGGAGADDLTGGQGDDTYIIDAQDGVVHEGADEGRDTVRVGFSGYTLAANVEDMTFTGGGNFAGTGNDLHNFIRGGAGNDTLAGGNGDDSLHGGAGADRMDGGAGNDTYWVDNTGDVIVDSGVGFDRVLASADYTLAANLDYLAFEGSGNFSGTGNDLDNTLYGNTGANTLDGGAGRDQIDGGEGADRLLGGAGDDTITDWKGDDVLDGGAGKDDLRGGVGNDTYWVDGLDLVTELAGQGVDTVTASESFALGAAAEVEILMAKAGTNAINLTGSDTANAVSGNDGANALSGMGGDDVLTGRLGSDTLTGGLGNDRLAGGIGKDVLQGDAGADSFVFDSRITKADADRIVAYNPAEDRILIENDLVKANKVLTKAVGKGTEASPAALAKKFFTVGSKAKDKDDFFVLNTRKFTLSYDADGSGSKAAVVIATFDKNAVKTFIHKELFFI